MSDQLPMGQIAISRVQENISLPSGTVARVQKQPIIVTDFRTLESIEIEHIERALAVFENNKSKAAQALGVTTKTLYNKLHAYGLFEKYQSTK